MPSAAITQLKTPDAASTVTALRAFIKSGEYRPGDRLPSERDLIGKLGISRTILRKAFDTLEREGTIWRHVGKGTFIAPGGPQEGNGSLADLIEHVTPVTLMRTRLSLEPAIAGEAAINATQDAVSRLDTLRQQAVNAEDWDSYEALDDQFHREIALATDNVLLLSLFDQLNAVRRGVAWNTVVRTSVRPSADHTSFAEHDRIVAAIKARDPNAAQTAMRAHLRSVANRLFGEA